MTLFRYILPISLALYFIWRARKQRLFLLGIPFLQVMGNSIFFENARMFWWPGRLGGPILILLWIFVAWFFICVGLPAENRLRVDRNSWFGKRLVLPDELFIIVLVIILCINFGIAFTQSSVSLQTVLNLGSMFIGYFLLRGIFNNTNQKDLIQFLEAVILVNTIACVLYILNSGFRLPIYLEENYQETTFGIALIIRTFLVMPMFSDLSVVYLLSQSKWNIKTISILFITVLSIYFTYTRSLVIGLIILVILSQLFLAIKNMDNFKKVLVTIPVLASITGIGFYLINIFYPQSAGFFSQRFADLSTTGIYGANSSFVARLNYLDETYKNVEQVNPAIGIGFIDPVGSYRSDLITAHAADNLFIGIVYRYGIIGVICFLCLFGFTALRGLRMFLFSKDKSTSWLWLACFLWICFLVYDSMFSWTIFDPSNYALALWLFALVESRFVLEKNQQYMLNSYTHHGVLMVNSTDIHHQLPSETQPISHPR